MAQYRNVKEFLDKINDKYKVHRAEYERLNELFNRNVEEWKKELARGWSNQQMQKEARAKHEAEQSEIRNALDELRTTASKDFENILAEADDVFGRYNRATGDKLDLATVELLKSGILSDNEIKALAKDFEGNVAMLRIIGKYADERASKDNIEMIALAHSLKNAEIPYREPLERLVFWSENGLKDDTIKAMAHNNHYENTYNELVEQSEGVYIKVSD
jgi:cell division septum initiation protein DivIVA